MTVFSFLDELFFTLESGGSTKSYCAEQPETCCNVSTICFSKSYRRHVRNLNEVSELQYSKQN